MRSFLKYLFSALIIVVVFLLFGLTALAADRTAITDWYIKDYQQEIAVNKDSSLDIIEKITADCGNLPNKHGIFRIISTRFSPASGQFISTPIKLISITDFNGKPYQFSETSDRLNHTISWKIGDPNVTVSGVNYYQIHYRVDNAIRFSSSSFDEFYWNLNGNNWQIETDQFVSTITFPTEVDLNKSEINLYSGDFGTGGNELADYKISAQNNIIINSKDTLKTGQGITLSVTTPKGIFTPYQPPFWPTYGYYIIPIIVLLLSILLWSKYGRDPKINPTIVPEFGIPGDFDPIEMGLILSDGTMKNTYISAAIIDLAVKKYIKIEEITSGVVFKSKDYKLIKLSGGTNGTATEKYLLDELFGEAKEIKLSSLKNVFYSSIPRIKDTALDPLAAKKLIKKSSRTWQGIFIFFSTAFFALAIYGFFTGSTSSIPLLLSAIITLIFSFLMTSRTREGAEMLKKVQGFKLYMETAEKYRERFNEKENIFEKFLPYAIMFGITKLWASKMEEIYGKEYFQSYHPYWYAGYAYSSFNVDSFDSAISGMSGSIASNVSSSPSSSGSGGGGFSGGGGGGGGGGGW